MSIRVTVWNEYHHEKHSEHVGKVYPKGIHGCIADFLSAQGLTVQTATQDQPEHGLTEEVLNNTDVLIWWGHMMHDKVGDAIVERVYQRVIKGMGIVVLHSAHFSKIFKKLMGTGCDLKWREHEKEREILWVARPGHPIVQGIDDHFILPHEEMYGEFFDIPEPEQTVLISSFTGGEVFRSGCCWTRGAGRVFYFRPGHETFPTYHDKNVQTIITNGVRWAAPYAGQKSPTFGPRDMGWMDKK